MYFINRFIINPVKRKDPRKDNVDESYSFNTFFLRIPLVYWLWINNFKGDLTILYKMKIIIVILFLIVWKNVCLHFSNLGIGVVANFINCTSVKIIPNTFLQVKNDKILKIVK